MKAIIQKWGNSKAIRLPKAILEISRMGENEPVQIFAERDKIIIRKAAAMKHRTLAERIESFEDEYTGKEWNTGVPVGKEVW
jgi:antitoxin MazE